MRDNQGLRSNARCPPLPSYPRLSQPRRGCSPWHNLFFPVCRWSTGSVEREAQMYPPRPCCASGGPVSDRCQQEHLGALPGLRGILGANGEHTHKRASSLPRQEQGMATLLNPSTLPCPRSAPPPRSASCEVKYVHPQGSRSRVSGRSKDKGERPFPPNLFGLGVKPIMTWCLDF